MKYKIKVLRMKFYIILYNLVLNNIIIFLKSFFDQSYFKFIIVINKNIFIINFIKVLRII